MGEMIYFNLEHAIYIHKLTIDYSDGGIYEHFDLGRLDSVLQNIQNNDYYPELHDKLTHLFWSVCKFHCFADGNKRLAITLCVALLICNGLDDLADKFFKQMEDISWNVASGDINREELQKIITKFLDVN